MARSLATAIRQDVTAAIQFVVANNPEAVDANLVAEGMGAGTDEARSESLSALLKRDPERLLEVLSVPLIPERMTVEERGQVLDAVSRFGGNMARGGVFIDSDPADMPDNLGGGSNSQGGNGGAWDWNNFAELLVGAGLTIYANETGQGGNEGGSGGSGGSFTPQTLPPWVMPSLIVLGLVVLAVGFWYFTRKR